MDGWMDGWMDGCGDSAASILFYDRFHGFDTALTFKDASRIPAWALSYVSAAYKAGLVKGTGNNMFNPLAEATRAEVVTLLMSAAEMQK